MRASLQDEVFSARPAARVRVLDTRPMPQAPLPIPVRSDRAREARWPLLLRRWWTWALPTVVFGAVAKRRWDQMDALVPGVDAGVWLDLGRALFGGEGRVTAGVYPPLVPFLLHVGQTLVGPLPAARVLAAASLFAVMVAAYAVASSGLHRLTALAVALSTGLASSVIEPTAYGGYPQNMAFALLVLAAFALAGYLSEGQLRTQAWAAAALSAAALTHHAYFALACLALALVWLGWLSTRPPRSTVLPRTAGAAVVVLVALLCFAPILGGLARAGYRPPFGGDRAGHVGALTYALREAPRIWLFVLLLGVVGIAATSRRRDRLWLVSAALMAASALPFALVGEPRLVPPFILGACLGVGLALERVRSRLTNPRAR
ncbi:MAG: hypothetical protein M3Q10_08005, partial [Chloroflexota bacterium]|nr:hypothetical protein [Chloroflexota bacterium]